MNSPYERLQAARRKANFLTASDAARAFGWNENTYRSHENGERGLKPEVAARYAKAFRTDLAWLLTGQGGIDQFPSEGPNLPPLLQITGGGVIDPAEQNEEFIVDFIAVNLAVPVDAYIVATKDLYPAYQYGDIILAGIGQDINSRINSDVIAYTAENTGFIGKFVGSSNDLFVQSRDSALFKLEALHAAMPIVCVVKWPFYELRNDPARE